MAVLWRISNSSKTVALAKSKLKRVYAPIHMSDRAFEYELDYPVPLFRANTILILLSIGLTGETSCFIHDSGTFPYNLRLSNQIRTIEM